MEIAGIACQPEPGEAALSLRILLENLLRNEDGRFVRADDIKALASWMPGGADKEIAFMPARVLLQDFTGVPAVVDLAAMREAVKKMGGNPEANQSALPCRVGDRSFSAGGQFWERRTRLD